MNAPAPQHYMSSYELKIEGPTALYRLFAADDELLYIGLTKNLKVRFATHAKEKGWWSRVARQEIEWHETRDLAKRAEREAIRLEGPTWNIVDAPVSKLPLTREESRDRWAASLFAAPADQKRLLAIARLTDETVRSVITRAVTDYLDRHDPDSKPEEGDR